MRSSTGKKQGQTRRKRTFTAEQKFPEDHKKPMLEQVYPEELESMKNAHTGAWEQCEEEGAAGWEFAVYLLQPLLCNSRWDRGLRSEGVRLGLGMEGRRVVPLIVFVTHHLNLF